MNPDNFNFSDISDEEIEQYKKRKSGEQKVATAPQEDTTISDAFSGALQGATFGFADELAAAKDILMGKGPQDADSLFAAYRILQKQKEAEYEEVKKRSPHAALAGELLGGVLLPVPGAAAGAASKVLGLNKALKALGFGERLAGHVGTGATMGGLSGLGTSRGTIEGTPGEIASDVLTSSVVGGGIGGGLGIAADIAGDTLKTIKSSSAYRKANAAYEMESGTRAGYEKPVDLTRSPEILPLTGEEKILGPQDIRIKMEAQAEELAKNAVEVRRAASENLQRKIGEKSKDNGLLIRGIDNDKLKSELSEVGRTTYPDAILDAEKFIAGVADADIKAAYNNAVNLEGGNAWSALLNPKSKLYNPQIDDIFSKYHNKRMFDKVTSIYEAQRPNVPKDQQDILDSIKRLRIIADARGNPKANPDVKIRNILERIDDRFINGIKNDNVSVGSLFEFRQQFLDKARELAQQADLNPEQWKKLFGVRDENTGKFVGGLFDDIDRLLENSSPEIKNAINQVKAKSEHIETLLNGSMDPKFHGIKAWSYGTDKLRNILKGEFVNVMENIGTNTDSAQKAGNTMRKFNQKFIEAANNPGEKERIAQYVNDVSDKIMQRGDEFAAAAPNIGIDRTAETIKASAFDVKRQLKESGLTTLAAKAGALRRNMGKQVGEIPSVVTKPISSVLKAPFTFRNATKESLQEAADFLKSSSSPSAAKFGQALEESNLENPAVRAALINSGYQNKHVRRALGLSLGEEEKKEEKEE
jgi:hypothetical protein